MPVAPEESAEDVDEAQEAQYSAVTVQQPRCCPGPVDCCVEWCNYHYQVCGGTGDACFDAWYTCYTKCHDYTGHG